MKLPLALFALACGGGVLAQETRLRLVPIVSSNRLEDIQESLDGTRLITHDRSFAPKLWDAQSMVQLATLGGEGRFPIAEANLSLTGTLALTRSSDRIRIFATKTGREVAAWRAPIDEAFTEASLSPDNKHVVIGSSKGRIWRAEAKAGAPLATLGFLPGHSASTTKEADVYDFGFSADSSRVVAGGYSPSYIAFELATGKVLSTGGKHGTIRWVDLSPDGTQILVTGDDRRAALYNAETGAEQFSWTHVIGYKGWNRNTLASALYVGKDSSLVLVGDAKGTMHLYDRKTGARVGELVGHRNAIREIRVSANGLFIGTVEDAPNEETLDYDPLKLWDVEAQKERPFKRGEGLPTAGEFTPDGSSFWIGYADGSIRKHDLKSGEIRTTTQGAVDPFRGLWITGDGSRLVLVHNHATAFFSESSTRTVFDLANPSRANTFSSPGTGWNPNSSGTAVLAPGYQKLEDGSQKEVVVAWNILTTNPIWGFWDACEGAAWGGSRYALAWDKTSAAVFDLANQSFVAEVLAGVDNVWFGLMTEDGRWALLPHDRGTLLVGTNGNPLRHALPAPTSPFKSSYSLTPDSKSALIPGPKGLDRIDLESGRVVATFTYSPSEDEPLEAWQSRSIRVSPDSRWVLQRGYEGMEILEASTMQRVAKLPDEASSQSWLTDARFSPDGLEYLGVTRRTITRYRVDGGKFTPTSEINFPGPVRSAQWTAGGKRILVIDENDQLSVLDATGTRLGQMVFMKDGSWLVLDESGRFDASDPSNVTGASYVMEWEGGMEPIDVSQMKALYYEPGLLAKLLLRDPAPVRTVPALASIQLYPELRAQFNRRNAKLIDVAITERAGGGIGTIRTYVNGKQVEERKGVGFFNLDPKNYQQHFLPAARLPEGEGNTISFTVTNARGDLMSRPSTLDVGVPEGLQTPEVNLYGLFVGVGDYVGIRRDLNAPPSDAKALAAAVRATGEALLPKRVHLKTLTTEPEAQRPTREAILGWMEEVAGKATSSDIVVVFLSGHGTSRIGEQNGYFFLTADADPGDVTPAILGRSTVSAEDLQTALKKIAARKQIVILDTCHSGAATDQLLASDRSVSGDYARAYEAIKDSTGTWVLAGAAADQLSYESANVEHGLLTYALLEGIDQASPNALRLSAGGGDLFVDVERWFTYAANRVESLKNEVGIPGIQRPEFRRQLNGSSFDIGTLREGKKGIVGLKPPKPIVILGPIEDENDEDGLKLEPAAAATREKAPLLKVWTDVQKHPNVFRIAGSYTVAGSAVSLKINIQQFDREMQRTTKATLQFTGTKDALPALVEQMWRDVQKRVLELGGG